MKNKNHKALISFPDELNEILRKIDISIFGSKTHKQQEAKKTLSNWVQLIWNSIINISHKITDDSEKKHHFSQELKNKLLEFIEHKDHGLNHSYFVYKGMVYIDKLEECKLPNNIEIDKEAQLMALLHDSMQTLPLGLIEEDIKITYENQKDDHAHIISKIVDKYGSHFGFNIDNIADTCFGLKEHDCSYKNIDHSETFDYVSKLLHDADKIFGASIDTNIEALTTGLLKRNFEANRGPKGSYLIRTDFDKRRREKIEYGDRCFSDCVSLVRKEFYLPMATTTGKKIAQERRKIALEKVNEVYGYFYDLTYNFINSKLTDHFQNPSSKLTMSIVGMDQEEKPLNKAVNNLTELKKLINQLYKTPIIINNGEKFEPRYSAKTDARGLKIHLVDTDNSIDLYLDPSIARFCFSTMGRKKFLQEITKAFTQ